MSHVIQAPVASQAGGEPRARFVPRVARRALCAVSLTACVASLHGCGAGTAAAVSSGGGSSGGNAPPSMSGLMVLDPKVPSLARVRFVLTDVEANPAQVELFYQAPGSARRPMTQVGQNPLMLATSRDGLEHELPWNFADEVELPDDARFVEGVRVIASVQNGLQEIVLGANDDFGLGNDAPVVSGAAAPAPEVDGIVPVTFTVSDTSDDLVSVKAEFDIVGDSPDVGWRIARPGGLSNAAPTPQLAFPAVQAPASGTELVFFWDTDDDLAELERDVRVRFTAMDVVVTGAAVETPVFRVDNNEEPIVTVSGDLLLVNPDQRAGIPIPYIVRDEESDEVQVVFQWKRPDEDFPPLPDTPAEINAILADPVQRRERHICTEYPTYVEGRVVPIDSTHVRLPELATTASSILAHGIVGRELEIMRATKVPKPIAATWASNPLNHPVAALPVGDGIEALVLDRATAGAWRLRQIDLATGVVTRHLVPSAPGEPNAMAFERDEQSVLVASDVAGAWQLARVALAADERQGAEFTPLIAFDGSTEAGAVRGLAVESANSAFITLGSSLIRLDYSDPRSPHSITVFADLAAPWGVAVDPTNAQRLYLAEFDAPSDSSDPGRVITINLARLERRPLTFGASDPSDAILPGAQSIAVDRRRDRLLLIQDLPFDDPFLLGIDLGSASPTATFALSTSLPGISGGIRVGPDQLVVIALTSQDDLAVGGGIEQRRLINGFEAPERTVRVSAGFLPALSASQSCRVRAPMRARRPATTGSRGSFVWDSADLPEGGPVRFRAVPTDAEKGTEGATEAAKLIRAPLDTEPVALGSVSVLAAPQSVTAGDLDGDGDLDLASANAASHTLTVFFQESPAVFRSTPLSLGDASVTNRPVSVTAADLDGDEDLDLASANADGDTLTVFFQTSPGVFGATPLSLGNASVTNTPYSVAAADLDDDGDLDLVSANYTSSTLTVFFQTSPGVFGSTPLALGNSSVTNDPFSVAAADLDGDGDLDLASANSGTSTLTVFFQTSPGVFGSTPLVLGNASATNGPVSVAAADLDCDGDLDLASANQGSNTLTVFFQTSAGVFGSTPLSLGSSSATLRPQSVAAADLDGDGDLDLASANHSGNTITAFFQQSPGVFATTPLALGDPNVDIFPASLIATDLDGDGDLDLASADEFTHVLTVHFQDSGGVFGSAPLSLGNATVFYNPGSVAPADIDGDGDLDLASANDGNSAVSIFFQDSVGVFASTPIRVGDSFFGASPGCVAAGDLDGDGDLDLVSADWESNALSVFFQESPGTFGEIPITLGSSSVTRRPRSVVAADLDGDGDLDLASANQFSDTLTLFFQVSSGVFDSTPLSLGSASVTDGPFSVTAADLDGDGDLDLASANLDSDTLTIFFQSSPGDFGSIPLSLGNSSVTNGPSSVTAADLDGDGDLDLASANAYSNQLTVFFQQSAGLFGSTPIALGSENVTIGPQCVTAGDFDGDGDVDLASANRPGNNLTVFLQVRPGVFGETHLALGASSVTDDPESIIAADLDGDGDLDLASRNSFGKPLTVFWNNH